MALLSPTYPPAPPLLTPESAQGPGGLWNQEFPSPSPNSNQMAQVENHCSPGPSRELAAAVPGVCAVRGEDESTSTPPHPHEYHGVLGPRARAWGMQAPQRWHED